MRVFGRAPTPAREFLMNDDPSDEVSPRTFWAALAVAVSAAGVLAWVHPAFRGAGGLLLDEIERPLLVTVTLAALAVALVLVYGGPESENGSPTVAPRSGTRGTSISLLLRRPALWTAVTLSLLLLFGR
jgi:hypothetical protein